ncbi:MAG: hypothetical protein CBC42_00730 [Betaproteobacteria bacterium TMED82]|jgi:cytochrome c553|nr:MAG: hypothetical protein CBC42_00730 [Betaproteobacteria bacterium TMED82]|tara:strand:+ start:2943 stop:3287 length:345 start_codon:yes stop_codon:yes gene_type:complete
MLIRITLKFCAIFPCLVFCQLAYSLSVEEAKDKANQVCAACHGKDGVNAVLPSYPILAGQHADYLNQALMDYKSGARKNAVMAGIAGTLSKSEMLGLANYFASLPSPLNVKRRQ